MPRKKTLFERLITRMRPMKRVRAPLAAVHYRFWRMTGRSGVSLFRPELSRLAAIARRSTSRLTNRRGGERILFFSFRGWNLHTISDALLAHALRLRGAEVQFFSCGGRLPVCDISAHTLAPPMPCNICAPFVTGVASVMNIPSRTISDLLDPSERSRIAVTVGALNKDDYESFLYAGLPLGQLVRASLQWFMLTGTLTDDPETLEMYRRFLISAAEVALAFERLVDEWKPDQVVLLNGLFFAERVAIELCRRRGISFVTHEIGMTASTFVYAREEFVPYYELRDAWMRYKTRPLTPAQDQLLDAMLLERQSGGGRDVSLYYPVIEADSQRIIDELKLDIQKPIVSLFTNVDWDTATFAARSAFSSMEEWLVHTIGRFALLPSQQLVIRIHPAEVRMPFLAPRETVEGMLRKHFDVLPPNVRVIGPESPLSSYALAGMSVAGLTYTSTVGLEMSISGKPVVVAGRAYYSGRGFTFDAQNVEHFDTLLDSALKMGSLSREKVELARRFAFLFFFRHHFRFPPLTVEEGRIHLDEDTLESLGPGIHRHVDILCAGILERAPFLDESDFEPAG